MPSNPRGPDIGPKSGPLRLGLWDVDMRRTSPDIGPKSGPLRPLEPEEGGRRKVSGYWAEVRPVKTLSDP